MIFLFHFQVIENYQSSGNSKSYLCDLLDVHLAFPSALWKCVVLGF